MSDYPARLWEFGAAVITYWLWWVSEAIKRADQEMLVPANKILNQRFLVRPVGEAGTHLETLVGINDAAKRMDTYLYDRLLAVEQDYRVEMNNILLPREPFDKFMRAADEYRNAISVWMKLSNGISDDEASREFRRLVTASGGAFNAARDEFATWLSQRQNLIEQARRELRH